MICACSLASPLENVRMLWHDTTPQRCNSTKLRKHHQIIRTGMLRLLEADYGKSMAYIAIRSPGSMTVRRALLSNHSVALESLVVRLSDPEHDLRLQLDLSTLTFVTTGQLRICNNAVIALPNLSALHQHTRRLGFRTEALTTDARAFP